MAIDYNSKNKSVGTKRGGGKSFNSYTGVSKNRDVRNNNKYTGFTVSNAADGGVNPYKTSGLQLNQVSRKVDTSYGKHSVVTRGGGTTSVKNVRGHTDVQPEC